MPAEAIHLSALEDTLPLLPISIRTALAGPAWEAARVGAMFVDLPYFESVTTSLLRHAFKLSPKVSHWGDIFHQKRPIALGLRIGEEGARLRRNARTREAGSHLIALALGYFSHAAVDTAIHPLVNRLAAARAVRCHDRAARQHLEIEKYQSVLFHLARHGRNYLGSAELGNFISLDATLLIRERFVAEGLAQSIRDCLGDVPSDRQFASWAAGYARFVRLLSGPLGRQAVSIADCERERGELFDGVDFPACYHLAVIRSIDWVTRCGSYLLDGAPNSSDREALLESIPEQSLDPI